MFSHRVDIQQGNRYALQTSPTMDQVVADEVRGHGLGSQVIE